MAEAGISASGTARRPSAPSTSSSAAGSASTSPQASVSDGRGSGLPGCSAVRTVRSLPAAADCAAEGSGVCRAGKVIAEPDAGKLARTGSMRGCWRSGTVELRGPARRKGGNSQARPTPACSVSYSIPGPLIEQTSSLVRLFRSSLTPLEQDQSVTHFRSQAMASSSPTRYATPMFHIARPAVR